MVASCWLFLNDACDFFTGSLEKKCLEGQAEYKFVVVCIFIYLHKPIQNLVSLVYSETSWVNTGLHLIIDKNKCVRLLYPGTQGLACIERKP
jgi:hypothetical protein